MESEIAITIDRNSVCMADDCDSHLRSIAVVATDPLQKVMAKILRDNFLPQIAGGKATWIAAIGDRTIHRPVAIVAQQWSEPRFIADPSRAIAEYLISETAKGIFLSIARRQTPIKPLEWAIEKDI